MRTLAAFAKMNVKPNGLYRDRGGDVKNSEFRPDVQAGQNGIKLPVQAPMPRVGAPLVLLAFLFVASGCTKEVEKVVYKCPEGQVKILENRGTAMEQTRCYTPGVSYTDYRPITQEKVK